MKRKGDKDSRSTGKKSLGRLHQPGQGKDRVPALGAIWDGFGPGMYFNRELSAIDFNRRVLAQSCNERHPLLERLKFLAISDSNLDEFFMVRVSGVIGQVEAGVANYAPDGLTPRQELDVVRKALRPMLAEQRRCYTQLLLPELAKQGVVIARYAELSEEQKGNLREFFFREMFPVCTPLAIDPGHPFPFISNLSVNLAVVLDDAEDGRRFARVKVPDVLPRLLPVTPGSAAANGKAAWTFVWLEELLRAHLDSLFPGVRIVEVYPFRVIRDADLEIQEIEAGDLLEMVDASVRRRRFGECVAVEINPGMSAEIRTLLEDKLEIDPEDVFEVEGPLGLSSLMEVYAVDRPDLKYPPLVPGLPPALQANPDLFAVMQQQDVLLHHPFDSFDPVVEFIERAARDPNVLAIKQTLYRVGPRSPIVAALLEATNRGKQVAVLVELKARFDEENNIEWARALERAGVHVSYGFLGLKTHCKLALVVRRDADGLRRYVHVGTGNYNPTTARLYTDLCLLTTRPDIGADVSEIFNYLTGYSRQSKYRKLLVAPVNMREALTERIRREVNCHQRDGGGRLVFKVNALVDPALIAELYRAAQAGVRVDLLVRGICCLHPDVPGISEGIRVISIVGRFLEHSRVYYFRNGGVNEEVYIGSADLMPRNLDYRVESLVPLEDPRLVADVKGILEGYLRDNVQATELGRDGKYHPRPVDADHPPHDMQAYLVAQIGVSRLLAGVGSGR